MFSKGVWGVACEHFSGKKCRKIFPRLPVVVANYETCAPKFILSRFQAWVRESSEALVFPRLPRPKNQ